MLAAGGRREDGAKAGAANANIRMNYELAKQLKEAGFPQQGKGYWEFPRQDSPNKTSAEVRVYVPTLEELIAACPKNIGKATFVLGSANQGKEWFACYFDFVTNRGSEFNESGSTFVEAVARLWLALPRGNTLRVRRGSRT